MAIYNGTPGDDTYGGTSSSDTISGNDGNDTLSGGGGGDEIDGGAGADRLDGQAGGDTLRGGAGNDVFAFTVHSRFDDAIEDFAAGDRIDLSQFNVGDLTTLLPFISQSGVNTVISTFYDGWNESITIKNVAPASLTAASFIFNTSTAPLTVNGTSSSDVLFGGNGDDQVYGGSGNDSLNGGAGADRLDGQAGGDTLRGGAGNDVFAFTVHSRFDDAIEDFAAGDRIDLSQFNVGDLTTLLPFISQSGVNTVISTFYDGWNESITIKNVAPASLTAASFIFNTSTAPLTVNGTSSSDVLFGGNGDDQVYGGSGNDSLNGGAGADRLDGQAGGDTLRGGAGNDVFAFTVHSRFDDAIEDFAAGDRIDLSQFNVGDLTTLLPFISQSGVNTVISTFYDGWNESITIKNVAPASLTAASFIFNTSTAPLTVNGTSSSDVLFGGNGDDQVYGGSGNDSLNGGAGADRLDGGTNSDRMYGGIGDDTYYVDNTGDRVNENANEGGDLVQSSISFELGANVENLTLTGSGNTAGAGNALANVLTGNSGNNWLVGLAGNDTLDGGLGGDRMEGGTDNDTYRVDNASDRVIERVNEGIDLVQSTISFQLGANVENLTLTGSGNTAGGGNALANVLTGNAGNNWLAGLQGNDVLDGGLGSDRMDGGADNDTYYVDSTGDRVNEKVNEGTDHVNASITFQLGANVENLTLTGNGNTAGAGNALANVLTGNTGNNWLVGLAGNDVIDGGLGADKMDGGADNDTYHVDNAGDRANEKANEGTDQVFASVSFELGANVENLTLTGSGNIAGGGNTLANVLTGNSGNNWLVGAQGNDVLDGGLGNDRLEGGADQDTFAFTTALGGNVDAINGFVVADDTIRLENAVFTGLAAGALAAGAFNTGAAATQADDRIIYNSATGALLFDVDGLGGVAGVHFATVSAGLPMTAGDFVVI